VLVNLVVGDEEFRRGVDVWVYSCIGLTVFLI